MRPHRVFRPSREAMSSQPKRPLEKAVMRETRRRPAPTDLDPMYSLYHVFGGDVKGRSLPRGVAPFFKSH